MTITDICISIKNKIQNDKWLHTALPFLSENFRIM